MENEKNSHTYKEFIKEYNKTGKERADKYSHNVLLSLNDEEREKVESLLIDRLEMRDIDALSVVGTQKSINKLKEKLFSVENLPMKLALIKTLTDLGEFNDFETVFTREFIGAEKNTKSQLLQYFSILEKKPNLISLLIDYIKDIKEITDKIRAFRILVVNVLELITIQEYIKRGKINIEGKLFSIRDVNQIDEAVELISKHILK